MIRRPPRSTRTDTLFPYTTLFRSSTIDGESQAQQVVDQGVNIPVFYPTQTVPGTSFVEAPSVYRSEEHTSELQSLMRISYAVFCLKKKKKQHTSPHITFTHTNDFHPHQTIAIRFIEQLIPVL